MSKLLTGLPIITKDNLILPQYFSDEDQPWLRHMLFTFQRWEGRPLKEWTDYLSEGLNFKYPYHKGKFALQALEKELTETQEAPPELSQFKLELFILAQQKRKERVNTLPSSICWNRREVIDILLPQYPTISLDQLESSLERSTGSEKQIKSISTLGEFSDLPRKLNGLLIRKIMAKSFIIEIHLMDQSRRLIRQAKLHGLICEVSKIKDSFLRLRISGPLALFGPTTIYGRKLQEFIPLLFWNLSFNLRASFRSNGQTYHLYLDSLSPLKISKPPHFFDSKLEEEFYHEFGKYTQNWELQREPEPISIQDRLIFPDFLLRSRTHPTTAIFIEIIGYWTKDYLKKKRQDMKLMSPYKTIFLINSKWKSFFEQEQTSNPNHILLYYKRKISPKEVLHAIETLH